MYPLRRIFQSTKYLKNYIYTSSVVCENSKKSDKHSKTGKKKVVGNSEFLKILKVKETKKLKEESSTDVEAKDPDLNSDDKSINKEKKSKKRQKIKEKIPNTRFENFFESPSTERALSSAAESVAEELGENKAEVKYDLMGYIKMLRVTKEKPLEPEYEVKSKLEPNVSLAYIFSSVKSEHIFDKLHDVPEESQVKLNIWDKLEREELEYLGKTYPRNHFEELIIWTNEGRMWKFPIDNEQGLDEEAKISFTQHIFLDQYLEPWCPKKGPLRRFMNLVLIGLGKNPYLSVEEKKEHIKWFQEYFDKKKKLLKDVGAVSPQLEIEASSSEEKSSN